MTKAIKGKSKYTVGGGGLGRKRRGNALRNKERGEKQRSGEGNEW